MSKLLAPVSASIPFNLLKFAFWGKFVEASIDKVLLVTQSGLPTTRISRLFLITVSKSN